MIDDDEQHKNCLRDALQLEEGEGTCIEAGDAKFLVYRIREQDKHLKTLHIAAGIGHAAMQKLALDNLYHKP